MRHIFLINPRAGKRDRTDRLRALADRLSAAHGLDAACLVTDRPGGAEPRAQIHRLRRPRPPETTSPVQKSAPAAATARNYNPRITFGREKVRNFG